MGAEYVTGFCFRTMKREHFIAYYQEYYHVLIIATGAKPRATTVAQPLKTLDWQCYITFKSYRHGAMSQVFALFVAGVATAPSADSSAATKKTQKRGLSGLGTYGALGGYGSLGGLGVGSAIALPSHGVIGAGGSGLVAGHTIGHPITTSVHTVITKQVSRPSTIKGQTGIH